MNRINSRHWPILLLGIILIAASCNQTTTTPTEKPDDTKTSYSYSDGTVEIAGKILRIALADSESERVIGLSGRGSIGEGSGMLFVFEQANSQGFWMKDMKFPIDIIWIYNNQVVDITEEVPVPGDVSEAQLPVYTPKTQIDKVLEVQSGWAQRHNVKIGDSIKINLK